MYPIKRTNEINEERLSVNFRMTIPTKFDKEVKEAIREDIERGLKLSAPQNIRDMIKVEIGNEEPVAFIGAMIEKGNIKRGDKFAVLDLGGGTLDYAFGLYRKATEEEEEEDEEVVNVLEVFNTDGNERGGAEYLINKISYSIYESNSEDMKNKKIPFIVPYDEKPIEYFPENLLIGKTTNSYLNLKYINEISKNILIDLESMKNEPYALTLKDINNIDTIVDLQVNSKEISSELIEKYMEKIVDDFIDLIQKNIPTPYDNLKIFRAGNGSRSKILESILDKKIKQFYNQTSIFPDELNQDGVNSKTAVVLGEVNLSGITNIKVIYKNKSKEDEVPFEFYVGRQDEEGSSAFEELIYKGSIERTWKKYGVVPKLKREKEIFYSDVLGISDIKDERLRRQRLSFSEEEMQNSGRLWIRPNVANKIEYVFSKEEPNEEITGAIIELKR